MSHAPEGGRSTPIGGRGFVSRRLYQLRHAPRPIFRAVLSNVVVATALTSVYFAYDLHMQQWIGAGRPIADSVLGRDARTEAAAAVVVGTALFGTLITFLVVPQPNSSGSGYRRSGWSALLGLFASLPIAYLLLVLESQVVMPLVAALG